MTIVAAQNGHKDQKWFSPFSSPAWAKKEIKYPVVKLDRPDGLTGLAAFLAENLAATHNHRSAIVTCYSAEGTERALIRERYKAKPEYAENVIKCYGVSESERAIINDWKFGLLRHGQTASDFWNEQSDQMVAAGVEIVKIRRSVGETAVEYKI